MTATKVSEHVERFRRIETQFLYLLRRRPFCMSTYQAQLKALHDAIGLLEKEAATDGRQ
jgi:hypothetical protein